MSKYKVYDKVWHMRNNRPKKYVVFAVVESADYWKRGTEYYYHIVESMIGAGWGMRSGIKVGEKYIYPTKNSLIENLKETA